MNTLYKDIPSLSDHTNLGEQGSWASSLVAQSPKSNFTPYIRVKRDLSTRITCRAINERFSYEYGFVRNIGTSVTRATATIVTALQGLGVKMPQPEEVVDYLVRHFDLAPILAQACLAAIKEFEADAQYVLEVFKDPDSEDTYLTLYIRQHEYAEEVMERIHKLWKVYEPGLANKSGWLLVTTDFQSPI